MEHHARIVGFDIVYQGVHYAGTDQVGRLCRHLASGTLRIYRGAVLSMTCDVAARATKSLVENETAGLRLVKYRPFDASVFAAD